MEDYYGKAIAALQGDFGSAGVGFAFGAVCALALGGCAANESESSRLVSAAGSKPGAIRITSSMARVL